jgi:putative spermidine/putrescine transport system substrate-binding protein
MNESLEQEISRTFQTQRDGVGDDLDALVARAMSRRSFLATAGVAAFGFVAAACGGGSTKEAGVKELRVLAYGGLYGDNQKKYVFDPYTAKTGVQIQAVSADQGALVPLTADAQAATPSHDVVIMGNSEFATAKKQGGLLAELDTDNLPNLKNLYAVANGLPYGVAVEVDAWGITYNTDEVKPAPDSWSFFWDKRYWDQLGWQPPTGTFHGLDNLMAAAIVAGGTWQDVDALAFDQVKLFVGHVTFQEQFVSLTGFQNKDIIGLPFDHNEAFFLAKENFPSSFVYPKEGAFPVAVWLGIPAKLPPDRKRAAERYINYYLSPEPQLGMATAFFAGPTNKTVELPSDLVGKVPHGDLVEQLVPVDWDFVNEHAEAWTNRWVREIEG